MSSPLASSVTVASLGPTVTPTENETQGVTTLMGQAGWGTYIGSNEISVDGLQTSWRRGFAFFLHSARKNQSDRDRCEYSCPALF